MQLLPRGQIYIYHFRCARGFDIIKVTLSLLISFLRIDAITYGLEVLISSEHSLINFVNNSLDYRFDFLSIHSHLPKVYDKNK